MILNFLQTRNPPVLPCLHRRPHQRLIDADGKLSSFADDLNSLRGFGQKNKETLGELLFHFFRRYAYEIDYEKNVVSVREGHLISKEAKKWHLMQNNRLCVEEPFNTERNLGNTADDISFRGLHIEIRRAFGLISEARLSACTEQYEYPAIEERVWEKPASKPPPVLTRSHSQSGRGGKSSSVSRGARNGQTQARTSQARRASSAATTGRLNGLQYVPRGPSQREHPLQAHFDQLQLHERFVNEFQFLQAQEQELRIRQAQAQLHANAHAQSSIAQQAARENISRASAAHTPPLTAPIQNAPYFYPFPYPSVVGDPSQGVHTNPSSPSMKPVQLARPELRRKVHRSSAADPTSSVSRSHSQPARPLPLGVPAQGVSGYPMGSAAFQQYQQIRQQQLYNAMELAQRNQRYMENHNPRPLIPDHAYEESLPKEYIGYYVHDSPPAHPYRDVLSMPQVPVYNDLQHVRPPRPDFSRLRVAPRSPSPSPIMPCRDRSQSVQSAASAPPGPMLLDRTHNPTSSLRTVGPIIANGSDEWDPNEYMATAETTPISRSSTTNTMNTSADEPSYQYPVALSSAPPPKHGRADLGFEHANRPTPSYPIPEVPRAADLMRTSRAEQTMRSQVPQTNGIKVVEPPARSHADPMQVTNGLGIQYENHKANFNIASAVNGSAQSNMPHSKQGQPVGAKADQAGEGIDNPLKPPSILSPVREVRSPSPTTILKRREGIAEQKKPLIFSGPLDLVIPPFSAEKHAQRKQKEALLQKPNGKVTPSPAKATETSDSVSSPTKQQVPHLQTNGWQQTTRKGKKKTKGHSSQASIDTNGEPIPADIADRKGG